MQYIIGSPSSIENSDPALAAGGGGRDGRGGIMERDQGGGQWRSIKFFVVPIMSLNAFNSSDFTIVARLTVKSREYFVMLDMSFHPHFMLVVSDIVRHSFLFGDSLVPAKPSQ
jgi:hypothetical protein